jgi:hypothetical protein
MNRARGAGAVAGGVFVLTIGLGLALGGPEARAADDAKDGSAVGEILDILKKRGDIDEEEYQRLAAKNAKHEENTKSKLPKIAFSGDFRGRYEGFWFDEGTMGVDIPNRERLRYRARLGATATINDYLVASLRLASGENDNRSTNTTLGRGVDFAPDDIFIDQAYLRAATKKGQIPIEGAVASATFGKVGNPFLWKAAPDQMLWDNDINPEGGMVQLSARPLSELLTFVNAGYFVLDENFGASTAVNKDPHLFGLQGGAELSPIEDLAVGSRLTWYAFRSLDDSFVHRGAAGGSPIVSGIPGVSGTFVVPGATNAAGNITDGLTGKLDGDAFDVGEYAGYVTWKGFEGWPITAFGGISKNFDARSSALAPNLDAGEIAWNAGLEIGDKANWFRFLAAFYHIEANAFPAQLIDSDITDGITNREAWLFVLTRQILRNTDLSLWVSLSDAIDEAQPTSAAALGLLRGAPVLSNVGADRIRGRVDLEVKF